MKRIRKYLILVSIIFLNFYGFAQNANQSIYQIPRVLPSAPTAEAFARYGDIPVDYSTGVPQIEIPLYTIKSGKLEVPISLSYHASGIKVDDISTPVGLGWVLKGMGMVSRTILDRPDEELLSGVSTKATYTSAQSYQNAVNAVPNAAAGRLLGSELYRDFTLKDKQSDRFNYELPGKGGGTFRYDFNSRKCVLAPYKPIKIFGGSPQSLSLTGSIPSFTITDETGTDYIFEKTEYSSQSNAGPQSYNEMSAFTAWYVTSIISPDGIDRIDYEYSNTLKNSFTMAYYSHSISGGIMASNCFESRIDPQLTENYTSANFITTREPLLTKITSSNTIVTFEYAADRLDWENAKYRLAVIKVWDKSNNTLIKEIELNNNSYFGSNNYTYSLPNSGLTETYKNFRLKLSGVTLKGNSGQAHQIYTFNYNGYDLPPYNSIERINTDFKKPLFSVDYWGYYNGAVNAGLVPYEFAQGYANVPTWGGQRRPDHNYAGGCMLKEIVYPTGGKTAFEFESNNAISAYDNAPVSGNVGGFRIKSVTNTSGMATEALPAYTTKTYVYSSGKVPHLINYDLFNFGQTYNWDYVLCGFVVPGQPGAPGRRTTQSSSFCALSFGSGAPVVYTNVTEYNGSEGINTSNANYNTGKTDYTYILPDDPAPEIWTYKYGGYWYDNGAYEPKLFSKVDYKNLDGVYKRVAALFNYHKVFRNNEFSTGVNVLKTSYDIFKAPVAPCSPGESAGPLVANPSVDQGYLFGESCNDIPLYIGYFSYVDTKVSEKISLLERTKEITYDQDELDTLVINTTYAYDDTTHLQPTGKAVIDSKGNVLKTEFTYPANYAVVGGNTVYDKLIELNRITPVIEQKSYNGSQFLQSVKTNYLNWGNNLIEAQTIETKQEAGPIETRLRYYGYNNQGKVKSLSKENGIPVSFLYGYSGEYPIAQVENAEYAVLESVLGGAAAIENFKNNPSPTDNEVIAFLAPLRSNPILKDAMVVSCTYKPLVGLTSTTDSKGLTAYYTYDDFGRLSMIRDHNQNIQKKFNYNYAGQSPGFSSGVYYNATLSLSYTKNSCGTGYNGSQVVYTVPPGKYSSDISQADADQKAQNDADLNGQTYANTNGSCQGAFGNVYQSGTFTRNNCGVGFTGTSYTYSVIQNTYYANTQAAANQLALEDIQSNGQNHANLYGSCNAANVPFARITLENQHFVFVPDGSGYNNQYYDIVVRFYSDQACTIPISVSNLSMYVRKELFSNNSGHLTSTNEYVNASGTAFVLYSNVLCFGYLNGDFIERYFILQPSAGYIPN